MIQHTFEIHVGVGDDVDVDVDVDTGAESQSCITVIMNINDCPVWSVALALLDDRPWASLPTWPYRFISHLLYHLSCLWYIVSGRGLTFLFMVISLVDL